MNKEYLTTKQGISTITMFIIGSSLIMGGGNQAGKDAWIANAIGGVTSLLIISVYVRILTLFPEKDLFHILEIIFGKILGKIISFLFFFYSFHLGALIMRNLSGFIHISAMPETPEILFIVITGLLYIFGAKKGVTALGGWSELVLPILLVSTSIVFIISIGEMDISNIQPIVYNNFKNIIAESYSVFSFPFAETVLFLMIGDAFQEKTNKYKVYNYSVLIGGITLVLVTLRNYLIMGETFINSSYFSSYIVVGIIQVGSFLQRFEVFVALVFLCGIFVKGTICLIAACKSIGNIFDIDNYKRISGRVGIIMVIFSAFLFSSFTEMINWAYKVHKYYAFPFQVVLPIIIWISSEIYVRRKTFN